MRIILPLSLCFLLLFAVTARAGGEIVVFNVQKVATECGAGVEAKAYLEKKFGAPKDALEKQRASLEKKFEALKGKATEKQQVDLNKQHKEYTEKAQAFMRGLQAEEMRVRQELDNLIVSAARTLATRKGYSLILDSAAAIYAGTAADVTAEMLAEANETWQKAKAGSAPAAPEGKEAAGDKGAAKTPAPGK